LTCRDEYLEYEQALEETEDVVTIYENELYELRLATFMKKGLKFPYAEVPEM